MNHFLSIEDQKKDTLTHILERAAFYKAVRGTETHPTPLNGQTWGMIFTKSSTRTRLSFEVGVSEMGGNALFLSSNDLQLGRGEPIKDTARVMGRMLHGIIIRTFAQSDIVGLADYSGIPVINALTDDEHPCQIMADLLTIQEKLGDWKGQKVAFIGDGFSNMTISWMWAAKILQFDLVVASPTECAPTEEFLRRLDAPNVTVTNDPATAIQGATVINTDVWLSMGQEGQAEKEVLFADYQVNASLLENAAKNHIVLHCLPAYREKEITEEVLELHAGTIFQQAENRLHAQKAVLEYCVGR